MFHQNKFEIMFTAKDDDAFITHSVLSGFERNMSIAKDNHGKKYKIRTKTKPLEDLLTLMRRVVYTDKLPYEISAKGVRIACKEMEKTIPLLKTFSSLVFHDVALPPDLELFQKEFRKHPIKDYVLGHKKANEIKQAELCNDFILTLRAEAKKQRIKAKIKDWERGSEKNLERIYQYIPGLFEVHGRINVIRVDLYYHSSECDDQEAIEELSACLEYQDSLAQNVFLPYKDENSEPPSSVSSQKTNCTKKTHDRRMGGYSTSIFTVTEDWRRLMDNKRGKPSLFKHLIGYVAVIECSRIGGYHIHAAFLFNGAQVQKDAYLADQIGKYWVQLTDHRGYYHNCNASKYKYPALGIINHDDDAKRRNLMLALAYFAKKDQFVRIKPTLKTKTFFTGHLPRKRINKKGRPRRNTNSEKTSEIVPSRMDAGFPGICG